MPDRSVPLAMVALLAPLRVVLQGLWLFTIWPFVFFLAAGIVQARGEK